MRNTIDGMSKRQSSTLLGPLLAALAAQKAIPFARLRLANFAEAVRTDQSNFDAPVETALYGTKHDRTRSVAQRFLESDREAVDV
jgi:hypothetical protein